MQTEVITHINTKNVINTFKEGDKENKIKIKKTKQKPVLFIKKIKILKIKKTKQNPVLFLKKIKVLK